jgi:hypothetical protein
MKRACLGADEGSSFNPGGNTTRPFVPGDYCESERGGDGQITFFASKIIARADTLVAWAIDAREFQG